jgi:queuine tRNA-ribosyltransferase
MPVGTQGSIKGVSTAELQLPPLDCDIILGNTYHLGNRPGGDTLEALGGLHAFMGWNRNILTDSGGFQMVSLLQLAEITEEGVNFQSPVDGSMMLLTPEMSIGLQNQIGSDIMMALDDVVDSRLVDPRRFEEACFRTLRWIDRCIRAHARPTQQNLYGIIQGGLDTRPGGLRDVSLRGMLERDANLPAYAIGGLAGGEDKSSFWRVVHHCCQRLPQTKPRYLMGVGYPLDLVVCSALGVDQYDCVYPTRTARFGTALLHAGLLKLKSANMAGDDGPIDPTCACFVCRTYSRSYLHRLLKADAGGVGPQLISHHNIAYMMRLTRDMRQAVIDGGYPDFARAFVRHMFSFPPAAAASAATPGSASASASGAASAAAVFMPGLVPSWVVDACAAAGFDVIGDFSSPQAAETYTARFRDQPRANALPSLTGGQGAANGIPQFIKVASGAAPAAAD